MGDPGVAQSRRDHVEAEGVGGVGARLQVPQPAAAVERVVNSSRILRGDDRPDHGRRLVDDRSAEAVDLSPGLAAEPVSGTEQCAPSGVSSRASAASPT